MLCMSYTTHTHIKKDRGRKIKITIIKINYYLFIMMMILGMLFFNNDDDDDDDEYTQKNVNTKK